MNKFGIILCLLAISFSVQKIDLSQIDIEVVYDKVAILVKGMSENGENKCSANLIKNKAQLLEIIKSAIVDLNNGLELSQILAKYAVKLIMVDKFTTECKVYNIAEKVLKLKTEKGIKDLGYNIVNNSKTILDLFEELKNAPQLDDKLVIAGKLIKTITDFTVY